MNTLPLPTVTEISFDDVVVLLPADCKIQLTPCPLHQDADKTERMLNTTAKGGQRPRYPYFITA